MTTAFIGWSETYNLLQPILSLKRKTRENLTTVRGSKKSKKSKFIGNGWCWYQRFRSEVRDWIDHKTQVFTHPKTSFSDHDKPAFLVVSNMAMAQNYLPPKFGWFPTKHDHLTILVVPNRFFPFLSHSQPPKTGCLAACRCTAPPAGGDTVNLWLKRLDLWR